MREWLREPCWKLTDEIVCGRGVRSILLLPLVARCLETIDVCIWRMFVFMSVVVSVWECLLCASIVKNSVF